MGLSIYPLIVDKSMNEASSSYSGFHDYRQMLWRACGRSGLYQGLVTKDAQAFSVLFNHADNEGYLTPDECHKLLLDFEECETQIKHELGKEEEWMQEFHTDFYEMVESCANGDIHMLEFS